MPKGARREDMGSEYARKLEELHREEQLIQEEELEAEALLSDDAPSVAADEARFLRALPCCTCCAVGL